MAAELKPCPWCGYPVEVIKGFGLYAVSCQRYHCDRQIYEYFNTEQEAIDAWERETEDG